MAPILFVSVLLVLNLLYFNIKIYHSILTHSDIYKKILIYYCSSFYFIKMSLFKPKINKTERPDTTPYTLNWCHSVPYIPVDWSKYDYIQTVSIDPARKHYAFRIERRYFNGIIVPIAFEKLIIEYKEVHDNMTISYTDKVLDCFLSLYTKFYDNCHIIYIERQLPHNYKATRAMQHTISYFEHRLRDNNLLTHIYEVDPKLKGKILNAPKGLNENALKSWAVQCGRSLLSQRNDSYSIWRLDTCPTKLDDLCDTVCQAEAMAVLLGLPLTRDIIGYTISFENLIDVNGDPYLVCIITPV